VIGESESAAVVAIVDPDPATRRVADAVRARWFASLDELLDSQRLDFVVVAAPTQQHAELALRLLREGVPVLLEKPIASTVDEARSIVATASETGTPLAVGHVERFNPAVRELQRRLDAGALGRVFQVHTRRLSPFPVRVGDTGVAMDLATHDLDLMCLLAGTPLRIAAETSRKAHRTQEDLLAAVLRFDTDIVGLLEVNWLTPAKVRRLTVTGERGMFVVDYLNQHLTLYENAQARETWETLSVFEGVTEGNVVRFAIAPFEPLRAQLESFIAAVQGESPIEVTAADGLNAVRLALTAAEAGATGATIELAVGVER
jgi:predicted dehydrogenase